MREEEVPADGQDGGGDTGSSPSDPPHLPSQRVAPNWGKLLETIKARRVDFGMWLTRLLTIWFGFLYFIPFPIFGNVSSFYYKTLLAAAATSALRLHQRLPVLSFSRIFLANLLLEDSCHYFFYCLIFLYCQPITLALVPVELFAILHFASFSLNLLDALGRNNVWIGRVFISIVELQTVTILKLAAGAEIVLFVFAVCYTFAGKASIVTPFTYYRFLTLRYASRRNHYTRTMFAEIRVLMDHLSRSPRCPSKIGLLIQKGINLISNFAPPVPPPAN